MKVQKDAVVKIAYRMKVLDPEQGEVLVDEKSQGEPIEFIFGYNTLLPAVESHLLGEESGFELSLRVPPEQAFGVYHPELEVWYERSKLPPGELQVGMKFQTQASNGEVTAVVVKEIDGDQILLDGNHPLAGFTVIFEIEILGVRAASAEELRTRNVRSGREFH